jgi:hypothetical protein
MPLGKYLRNGTPMKTKNSNLMTFFFGEIMTKPIFCYKKAYGKHA